MCTSITYKTNDFYFGRNMDLDYHFGEQIIITPQSYALTLKHEKQIEHHHAIIGIGTVIDGYPLYADGANEKGLCVSAQNFPGNAHYEKSPVKKALNLTPYEIIPYILANFSTVSEVKSALTNLKIIDTPFNKSTPTTPLHWHIADENESCVLESTNQGVKVYENPAGVMTNCPPLETQLRTLSQYSYMKPTPPPKCVGTLGLDLYGIPGDFTSISRFCRVAVLKKFTNSAPEEAPSVSTVFRLMYSVAIPKGATLTVTSNEHYTIYTSVINATRGIYYYTTSENPHLKSRSFHDSFIKSDKLEKFSL